MRLVSFDYFRGLAILTIIAGHSYSYWKIDTFPEKVLANLISGGTSLFVFISGFFFHYVFYRNFHYIDFLKKKGTNVLMPYVFLSMLGFLYFGLCAPGDLPLEAGVDPALLRTWQGTLELLQFYLWSGGINVAYWYIPFIMMVFVLSPLFIHYIGLGVTPRLAIMGGLFCVALVSQRPAGNIMPFHALAYFLPVYLMGINCAIHKETVMAFIRHRTAFLGFLVVSLATLQALVYRGVGSLHKVGVFSFKGLDIIIIQKVILCFFVLSLLQKFEDREIPWLKHLAATSFALYFIHPWILRAQYKSGFLRWVFEYLPGFMVFLINFGLAVGMSLAIAHLVKRLAGRDSRMLTGW